MKRKIGDISVNYIQYGSGPDVVLLHGWGQNIEMMKPLGDRLQQQFRITILDFPGFGESEEPTFAWSIFDYRDFVKQILTELDVKNPIMIGHSFGGRVSIAYASEYPVEKVVLFGSPCIEKDKTKSFKVRMLKTAKKVPGLRSIAEKMKKYMGSEDYRNATPIMRNILVKTVNQDLSEQAKKISAPVLMIWGDLDEAAPLEDAKELEKLIPDAGLVVLPGCTHYAYLEALPQVINILKNFLS